MNKRRGEPDNHSISRTDAWDHVAKMLFPDHGLVKTYARDRWLIDCYRPPSDSGLRHQPASLLPGGITYISGMVSQGRTGFGPVYQGTPKELIAEVDRAYFRQSLREDVHRWFARHGFDPKQRTIPKHLFDAAVQAEFGQLPPEPAKPIEKGTAKAKPRKLRSPTVTLSPSRGPTSKKPKKTKPKKTQRTRLISLMEEIGLDKGLLDFEVREKIRPRFKKKYPKLKLPGDSTINRAYEKYVSPTDTSAE